MVLNLKKCKFFKEKIEYLRHEIRSGRFKLAPYTTDGVDDLNLPEQNQTIGILMFM